MNKARKSKKFPHVIAAPLLDKVLCLIFIPVYFYCLWRFFNLWGVTEASDKLWLLLFTLGISIGLFLFILKLFFAESILEDKWITKTNAFLMNKRIMYEEIKDVSVTSNNMGVRLDLVDRDVVTIYCGNIIEAVNVMHLINSKIKSDKRAKS